MWTLTVGLFQYERQKEEKDVFDDSEERGPCGQAQLFVTLTISKSFFLVHVILVIHVSYYITVYLNDVKSCIWFGYMCARRRL